jgi:hypothetical protein
MKRNGWVGCDTRLSRFRFGAYRTQCGAPCFGSSMEAYGAPACYASFGGLDSCFRLGCRHLSTRRTMARASRPVGHGVLIQHANSEAHAIPDFFLFLNSGVLLDSPGCAGLPPSAFCNRYCENFAKCNSLPCFANTRHIGASGIGILPPAGLRPIAQACANERGGQTCSNMHPNFSPRRRLPTSQPFCSRECHAR